MGLIKIKDKYYIEVPEKLVKSYGTNIDIVEVYPNLYVIKKLEEKQQVEELSEKEIVLVKKLGKIKYNKRIKSKILKDLTKEEKSLLWNLIKKKVLFQYKKDNEWFLGISKDYFNKIMKHETDVNNRILYKILENEEEANSFDPNKYYLVKSFDKKIYVVDKDLYDKIKEKILKILDRPKSLDEISKELNLNKNLIKCALEVMREIDCLVIEKEKNKFVRL